MIQYRVTGLTLAAAETGDHPSLADLRRHGPWSVQADEGAVVLTQRVDTWQPAGWGDWQDAVVPGRTFRLATNQPGLHLLRRPRLAQLPWQSVELACGESIRIPAAVSDGASFGPDGTTRRHASAYTRALLATLDRAARGEEPSLADWLRVVRLAIQAGHRITDDAIHGRDLIAHTDLEGYLRAISTAPKAEPAAGG